MTLTDLIDEALREIGADEKRINEAREFALSMYTGGTIEERKRLSRELTESEIQHYKAVIILYFTAVLTDPAFREKISKEMKDKLQRN